MMYLGKILIENLVGSDRHPENCSTISYLRETYFNSNSPYQLDPNRYGICLDIEHAFGAGTSQEELFSIIQNFKHLIGLIHFNGTSKGVKFGSRVDLHSYTPIGLCATK